MKPGRCLHQGQISKTNCVRLSGWPSTIDRFHFLLELNLQFRFIKFGLIVKSVLYALFIMKSLEMQKYGSP